MFQLAHAYIAERTLGDGDTDVIVGAILPDASISGLRTYFGAFISTNSRASLTERITFQDMHPELQARALATRMNNKAVARGILTHSAADAISHGGDDVSRAQYDWRHPEAYSFGGENGWWGRRFPRLQVNSYAKGMFLHNVAEVMLDAYVAQTHPWAVELLQRAICEADAARIGVDLAVALDKDPRAITQRVEEYLISTARFANFVRKLPRVNPAGMEAVLKACIEKCRAEFAESKTI